jgi:hypothetical protein
MGDGQEVQHGVGRAAGGHDHRDGVLDALARDDVARLESRPMASISTLADSLAEFIFSSCGLAMVDE